jgi:hypothetical protein
MLDIANQHPFFKDSTAQASWLINNTPAENYNPRLSGSLGHRDQKTVLGSQLAEFNPG